MSDSTRRRLKLLQLLPRQPRKITTSDLREHLASNGLFTTQRTVQRDLNELAGYLPIVGDDARPQGWYWLRDAPHLNLPAPDAPAAVALCLAEQYLARMLPPGILGALQPHFHSARRLLEGEPLGTWLQSVRALPRRFALEPAEVDPQIYQVLSEALIEGRCLAIRYRPRNQPPREYPQVHPLGLVVRDEVAYLLGTFARYEDLCQLALHRFLAARKLEEQRRVPPGFDLDAAIAAGELQYPQGGMIDLLVRFATDTVQHLLETPLAPQQRVEVQADGFTTLRATVRDTAELRWWLRSFGPDVEVLAPAELRAVMAEDARVQARRYG